MADDDQPASELVAQIPLPVLHPPAPSSTGLSLADSYPVYFSSALPEPIAGCPWLERFSAKAVSVELIGTEPARCLVATQDGQLLILQPPPPPPPETPKQCPSFAQPSLALSSFNLQSNPPHSQPAPHSPSPSLPRPSHELPTSRKASATVGISIPSASSTDQLIHQPLLTPSSPRSAVYSPPSPSPSPLDPLGRKQSIDSLWQGSLHHRTPSLHNRAHTRVPVSEPPPRTPVPPPAPQLPVELIPRSSTLLNSLPYSDRIIRLFPLNPNLAIILTRFGSLAKVSLIDGHITESIALSSLPHTELENGALFEFDDAELLTPPEQLPQNVQSVNEEDQRENDLILCVSSEGINVLVSYEPFFKILTILDPTVPHTNPTYCTTRILAQLRHQHGWSIDLLSLTWTGVLLERRLEAGHTNGIWTVAEPDAPIVVRDFGRELELEHVGVVVDGKRIGLWSGGRFWVFERAGPRREGAAQVGDAAGLRVDTEEDKLVRLFFLGGAGVLLITQRHVSLFAAAGLEQPRSGWAQARLHLLNDSKFTLPGSRSFEAAQNRSLLPPASAGLLDLVSHISLLTIDHDQSTGQRTISELVFRPAHPAPQKPVEQPKITHALKQLYLSPALHREGAVHLTCSVWLEDDHHPTLLVGDSEGRIQVHAVDPSGGDHGGMWKLERSVEEERLGGGVSALCVDENWVLAGGVSGEVGIWERVLPESRPWGDRLRLVDRIVLGAMPVEAFGWLAERRFVCVLMDGTLVVATLGADGAPETEGELAAEDETVGVSELWSNGQELLAFYRERRVGAQRWFCSKQLSARLERVEAEAIIGLGNQQAGPTWARVELSNSLSPAGRLATCGGVNVSGSVAFNTLSVRLRAFMDSIGVQAGVALAGRLWMVRLMVSQLFPWGIDGGLDECVEKDLGIKRLPCGRSDPLTILNGDRDERSGLTLLCGGDWQQQSSGYERTYQLLNVVVLLRVFLNEARYERHASEAIVGLARVAGQRTRIGEGQSEAWLDLKILVKYWLDRSGEIREAARLLFGVRLGAMADEEIEELVASWQGYLPVEEAKAAKTEPSDSWTLSKRVSVEDRVDQMGQRRVPEDAQRDAMLLIGLVVAERYKLLSSRVLKELSMAVFQTLSPAGKVGEMGRGRVELLGAALEVCSKAFEIIQNYIDAIELVRGLFGWATGRGGEEGTALKGMAKQACLHVASVNTPLFMTTLSYDLMTSQEAAERMSTMRLVVFMVRKRPLVLHGSLPRLAEAVVKSLDPTAKQMRAQTQTGATVILHELVRTYPSVAFHGASQRLAVGTPEGATVIYDLRTATRLSVLDSYRRPVTACSFSADGHRLVTVSLDEGRLEVWKTGGGLFQDLIGSRTTVGGVASGSIGGMFRFASAPTSATGPPGSTGISKPFKSLPFNVGEEALMSVGGTLEWVRIDWLGLRSCRLRIRESSLTFSC